MGGKVAKKLGEWADGAVRPLRKEYDKRASGIIIRDFRIHYFGDEKNAAVLAKSVNGTPTLAGYLEAHLNRLNEGEYFALLAYI